MATWRQRETREQIERGQLVRCKVCRAWINLAFGQDELAKHADAAGTQHDPRSPDDHDDICNQCDDKLERKLLHAIDMERRAGTRVKRAATLLRKWQASRRRIERRIGEEEVRRIVNSAAAIQEITQKKNTVRRVVRRLSNVEVRVGDYS